MSDVAGGVEQGKTLQAALSADVAGDWAGACGEVDAAGRECVLITGLCGGQEVGERSLEASTDEIWQESGDEEEMELPFVGVGFGNNSVGLANDSDGSLHVYG